MCNFVHMYVHIYANTHMYVHIYANTNMYERET